MNTLVIDKGGGSSIYIYMGNRKSMMYETHVFYQDRNERKVNNDDNDDEIASIRPTRPRPNRLLINQSHGQTRLTAPARGVCRRRLFNVLSLGLASCLLFDAKCLRGLVLETLTARFSSLWILRVTVLMLNLLFFLFPLDFFCLSCLDLITSAARD